MAMTFSNIRVVNGKSEPLKSELLQQIEFNSPPTGERVWLHILLRKRSNQRFSGLNDPASNADATSPSR